MSVSTKLSVKTVLVLHTSWGHFGDMKVTLAFTARKKTKQQSIKTEAAGRLTFLSLSRNTAQQLLLSSHFYV